LPVKVRSRYYEEMKAFAVVFGLRASELPADLGAFRCGMDATIRSLVVSEEARDLAREVLRPPAPPVLRPVLAVHRLATVGLLPPVIREGFGLSWSPAQERRLDALAAAVRAMLPLVPDSVRRWPQARQPSRSNRPPRRGERSRTGEQSAHPERSPR